MKTRFKHLSIGDTFDFIGPVSRFNSFFLRCEKISVCMYRDENGDRYRVGSTNCEVFHVVKKP